MQILMSFTGGAGYPINWPAHVAQATGIYADAGLEIELVLSSEARASEALAEGTVPLARRGPDPHLYVLDDGVPARIVGGLLARPPLHLFARPGFPTIRSLHGATLAGLPARNTATALLRMVLADGGLAPGGYELIDVGGAAERFHALVAGSAAAALLSPPYSARAAAAGFTILSRLPERYPALPYAMLQCRDDVVREHRAAIVALLRAEIEAARWLRAPENEVDAISILIDAAGMGDADARACYDEMVVRDDVYAHGAAVDPAGFAALCDILTRYGTPPRREPAAYLDLTLLAEAQRGV